MASGRKPISRYSVTLRAPCRLLSLAPSGPWISGMWAKRGGVRADRPVELGLAEGVGQVVVAADHVGDAHVDVVDHHRQHVGRRAVAAQQHHVVELLVGDLDLALHQVLDHGLAGLRRLQPDHGRHARRRLGSGRGRASGRRSASAGPASRCSRPHRVQLLGRGVAVIGLALGQQPQGDLGDDAPARSAWNTGGSSASSPSQPSPSKMASIAALGRPLPVGVLDPQQVAAAMVPREQPVEQARFGRRRCADNLWAKVRSLRQHS